MFANLGPALASGGLVGFSLGLVGGGGSILATPLLLYVVGVTQPHIAIGTSALAVSVNAFANLIGHAKSGNVRWRCAVIFAGVGTVGALAGSTLGKLVDGERLLFLFGLLMIVVGAVMLRPRPKIASPEKPVDLRTCLTTAAIAFVAGMASGFFGIGGGFLIVPGLMAAARMPMITAIGSSLVAVTAFGITTAVSYALSGLVDWHIAALFVAGGVAGGVGGTLLAHRLATHKTMLTRVFAGIVAVVGLYVVWRGYGAVVAPA